MSEVLTGNKDTVRASRPNTNYEKPLGELYVFLTGWIERNSKAENNNVTIITIEEEETE